MRWFKQRVMFLSVSKFGVFLYVHFLPSYTYDLGWSVLSKPRLQIGRRPKKLLQT
jgi:hypothetical protein